MSYKLAVFDMDGTILNTLDDLTDAVNYALEKMGYPTHTLEEIRYFVGNGMGVLIDRAVPEGISGESKGQVAKEFLAYYKAHATDKTGPYKGIPELLKRLKEAGVLTAVVSNKVNEAVQDLVKGYFNGLFDVALGETPGMAKKPAPDMTDSILAKLNVKPQDAVYIGDSDVDIMTARASGLDEILVEWGFRGREFLEEHGAKRIVSTTDEVYKLITE